jgi:hypothetical protein
VAGSVRGKALAQRRLGAGAARALAASSSLEVALAALAATPYRHEIRPGHSLAEAQRAVTATLLWHLRVLAGWLPREGADMLRLLAGWFEIAGVEELLHRLAGGVAEEQFRMGIRYPAEATCTSPDQASPSLAATAALDRAGEPYVGGETANVLEFAERPVLVVPPQQV